MYLQTQLRISNNRKNTNAPTSKVPVQGIKLSTRIILADPGYCNSNTIDFLIGCEYFIGLFQRGLIKLGKNRINCS